MFVVLDGGVALPVPRAVGLDPFRRGLDISDHRWKSEKQVRWQRAYTHCLYSLHSQLGEPVHKAVNHIGAKMLDVIDPNIISLRFIGEMQLAGYLKLHKRRMKGTKNKEERILMPTRKLTGLNLGLLDAPDTAIKMPAICGVDYLSKAIVIRHGVASRDNKRIVDVTRDLAEERFTVNEYILQLLKNFRPEDGDGKFKAQYMLDRCMTSAEQLRGQSFRFGNFLCSRSRMYTDTTCGLTPQGSDYEKALLTPCYSETLTPSGVQHLIRSAWGYSEIEWDMSIMVQHAREPEKHRDVWKLADKPYSYMACANILSMYDNAPESPLPAFRALDGRCSGLQHLSALCRSTAITAHLGMERDEHELDIYEKVASDWKKTLPDSQKDFATRKAAKVPVMTWGYNATRMTSMDHIDKLFGAQMAWCPETESFVRATGGIDRALAGRLGCDLYNQINDTLSDLTLVVAWISDCASQISKAGNPDIHWPTPDGFECKQRKLAGVEKELTCTLSDGEVFKVNIMDYSEQNPAHGKHRSAIAPNVVHSLDATHLRMVARKMVGVGLPSVFIHDSFATHVNHVDTMYDFITETFAELYSENWMIGLKDYWEDRYKLEISQPPKLGDWEPEIVKVLDNFFM